MHNAGEWLRLPRGIDDRDGASLDREIRIVGQAITRARLNLFEPLATAPVGYTATFERGRADIGDRTYRFTDRRGRALSLAPDSLPSLFRWSIGRGGGLPTRVAFISPIFRYRRQKYRYFRHLGFAILNETGGHGSGARHELPVLATLMHEFLTIDAGLKVDFCLTHHALWHGLLSREIECEARRLEFLQAARFLGPEGDFDELNSELSSIELRGQVAALRAARSFIDLEGLDVAREHLAELRTFHDRLAELPGTVVSLEFKDLHASEVQRGLAFRLISKDGLTLGDGGCYSSYASAYDPRLRSAFSVATGLDLLTQLPGPPPSAQRGLLFTDAHSSSACLALARRLRGLNIAAGVYPAEIGNAGRRALYAHSDWAAEAGGAGTRELRLNCRGLWTTHDLDRLLEIPDAELYRIFDEA